jgi:hypothetical protein
MGAGDVGGEFGEGHPSLPSSLGSGRQLALQPDERDAHMQKEHTHGYARLKSVEEQKS